MWRTFPSDNLPAISDRAYARKPKFVFFVVVFFSEGYQSNKNILCKGDRNNKSEESDNGKVRKRKTE